MSKKKNIKKNKKKAESIKKQPFILRGSEKLQLLSIFVALMIALVLMPSPEWLKSYGEVEKTDVNQPQDKKPRLFDTTTIKKTTTTTTYVEKPSANNPMQQDTKSYPDTQSGTDSDQDLAMDPTDAIIERDYDNFCTDENNSAAMVLKERKYVIDEDTCYTLKGIEVIDCYTQLSVKVNNPMVCYNLVSQLDQDQCIRHYALNYTSGCTLFDNNTIEALLCYNELSAFQDSPGYCDFMAEKPPLYLRSMCYHTYAFLKRWDERGKLVKILDKIDEPDIRAYSKALILDDDKYCRQISRSKPSIEGMRAKCFDCIDEDPIYCRLYISLKDIKLRIR